MREMYARCSIVHLGVEYIAGVEMRDKEHHWEYRTAIRLILQAAAENGLLNGHFGFAAEMVEARLKQRFPDRAYFIEVGVDDEWVQVYDPRDFVKERCRCRCSTEST